MNYGQPNETDDVLRAHARRLADALWALDSARSLYRKATSGAYRSSEKTGDAPWNASLYAERVRNAERQAQAILAGMEYAGERALERTYLNGYEERAAVAETIAANARQPLAEVASALLEARDADPISGYLVPELQALREALR